MYYWHWLGGHDRWYDWSLVATTSRTINHDCSYIAIANGDRVKHHRLVVQPFGTACDWSNYWSCDCLTPKSRTTGGATTHEWWCDHTRLVVRPCKTCLRLVIADRSQRVLNISDFARTITYDHPQPLRSVARFLYDLTAIPKFIDRNLVAGLVWLWQS